MGFREYSEQEREGLALAAHVALDKAKSAAQIREVWREHYGKLGHKVMGRLLLGQSPTEALQTRAERKAAAA